MNILIKYSMEFLNMMLYNADYTVAMFNIKKDYILILYLEPQNFRSVCCFTVLKIYVATQKFETKPYIKTNY